MKRIEKRMLTIRCMLFAIAVMVASGIKASDLEVTKADGSIVTMSATDFNSLRNDMSTSKDVKVEGTWTVAQLKNLFSSVRSKVLETVDMRSLMTSDGNLDMSNSFASSSSMTTIVLPETPHTLTGFSTAFTSCTSLEDVENLGTQKYIATGMSLERCFQSCVSIKSITLPAGMVVTNMTQAFDGCKKLEKIENIEKLKSAGGVSMNSCISSCDVLKDVQFPSESTEGDGFKVTSLHGVGQYSGLVNVDMSGIVGEGTLDYGFRSCKSLEKMILPNGNFTVTSLNYTFVSCAKLQHVDNFNKLKSGSSGVTMSTCFYGCNELTSVEIPENFKVTSLGSAFRACYKLTEVDLTNVVGDEKGVSMDYAFEASKNINKIILPAQMVVTNFEQAFGGCATLKEIEHLETLKPVISGVSMLSMFSGCSSLTSVTLPTVGIVSTSLSSVFNKCTRLERIENLPKVKLKSGSPITNMFNMCYSLTQVELGEGIESASVTTTCFGGANPNIVKILPEGTTDITKLKADFGANVCVKTGDGEAKLLSDEFLIHRTMLNGNSIPARYYSTYNIDLNGKKAVYRDATPNYVMGDANSVKWNTVMCPFTPTTFTVDRKAAMMGYENGNLTQAAQTAGIGMIRVAKFLQEYEETDGEVRALFGYVRSYSTGIVFDYMRANVPYIYEVSQSKPVEFISNNATETVANTETMYSEGLVGRGARSIADASTMMIGGYSGSMPMVAGKAYLSSDCQHFEEPTAGKWDSNEYGSDFMYNGEVFIDANARIWIPQDVQTAVETVGGVQATVTAVAGGINVSGFDGNFEVYSISGRQIYSGRGEYVPMPVGVYIVKIGTSVHKVAVK